jgi:hypothetical protein
MIKKQRDENEETQRRARRRYEAPAVLDRAEFETLALTCASTDTSCIPIGGQFAS